MVLQKPHCWLPLKCDVTFQSFVLRHLVIKPVHSTKKLS